MNKQKRPGAANTEGRREVHRMAANKKGTDGRYRYRVNIGKAFFYGEINIFAGAG